MPAKGKIDNSPLLEYNRISSDHRREGTKIKKKLFLRIALFLVLLGMMVGLGIFGISHLIDTGMRAYYPMKYSELISRYAEENELDPFLVYAVVHTESRFEADAESGVGARGLMQLTSDTFDWVKFKLGDDDSVTYDDMYSPEENIRYGTRLLSELMTRFKGETKTAVCAYFAGMNQVAEWLSDPQYSRDGKTLIHVPFDGTRDYLQTVMETYQIYTQLYGEQK